MKRSLILWYILITFSSISFGQIEKPITSGNINIGGNISLKADKFKDINNSTTYIHSIKDFELNLDIGYFIINQFTTGIKIDYLINNKKFEYLTIPDNYTTQDLLVGPIIRYYSKAGVFSETSFLVGLLSSGSDENQIKWKKYLWSAGIGYSIFLNRNVAIEPVIKYRLLKKDAEEIEEGKEINSGFIFSCGFQVFINSKK